MTNPNWKQGQGVRQLRKRSPTVRRFLRECSMLGELVEALERPETPDRWRQVVPGIYATTPEPNPNGARRRRIVVNLNPLQEQLKQAADIRDRFLELQQALHNARNPRRR